MNVFPEEQAWLSRIRMHMKKYEMMGTDTSTWEAALFLRIIDRENHDRRQNQRVSQYCWQNN